MRSHRAHVGDIDALLRAGADDRRHGDGGCPAVSRSLKDEGPPRRVVNEVRIEWDAQGAQPRAVRELIGAGGSRFGPRDQDACLDPRSFTLEPLAVLLASNRDKVRFPSAASRPSLPAARSASTTSQDRRIAARPLGRQVRLG